MDDLSDSEEVPNETRRGSTVRRRIGRGVDEVQGCTSVAGGMDAGSDCPFCQCSTKNKNPNTRLRHHRGDLYRSWPSMAPRH